MTPVDPSFFELHDPELGLFGNCFSASLAALMDLPLSEVPHFAKHSDGNNFRFIALVNQWLASKGFVLLQVSGIDLREYVTLGAADCFHLILGMVDDGFGRAVGHAVVGKNGEVFYDPNPDESPMLSEKKDLIFGFLVNAAKQCPGEIVKIRKGASHGNK